MITLQHAARINSKNYRKRIGRNLKPVKPSRIAELNYLSDLKILVRQLSSIVIPELLAYIDNQPEVSADRAVDALGMSFVEKVRALWHRIDKGKLDDYAKDKAAKAVGRAKKAVDERLKAEIRKSMNIDISPMLQGGDPRLSAALAKATSDNVNLIKSIPEFYFEKLESHLTKALINGVRHEGLKVIIKDTVPGIVENKAKLIARDQMSKINSSLNSIRQTSLGIQKYRWSTSKDERVRPSHEEKEGEIFNWDNPPEDTGHPGEDINCRCVAIPYFDLDALEAKYL